MNRNPVSAAIELLDTEPSDQFLAALRSRLLAELDAATAPDSERATVAECVAITARAPRKGVTRRATRRVPRLLLAAAACIAVLASAAVITGRHNKSVKPADELNDVKSEEALPMAEAALITPDELGIGWLEQTTLSDAVYAEQAAATIEGLPQCALLTSAGLFPPTTKSVAARRFFTDRGSFESNTVFVFASAEDASKAMDVIGGDVFATCWFSLIDRLTPLSSAVQPSRSNSSSWEAPTIAAHGDRQVIIGQHSRYPASRVAPVERYGVNAFVQVGRAIAWIDPRYNFSATDPLFAVNQAIDAVTDALDVVFAK